MKMYIETVFEDVVLFRQLMDSY